MAVKLDMSKAYDRVEWGFLKELMLRMGFAKEWVELIMKCITTSYTVNINGGSGRIFQSTRGLRQGDPLTPFLFLLCNERLSSLIRLAMKEGFLKGAKVSRRGLKISHLLFVDDCIMIFCCVLWAIWGDKNTRVHKKVSRSGKEIVSFVNSYILELNEIEKRCPKVFLVVSKWKHPPGQFVKVNFDAAYDGNFANRHWGWWPEIVKARFS
ncbi:hypothetical protein J1N35_034935 [Gossypium stocksii]|uniref:Reverse transcriptase domain-containing protein n=1 Tax=Gossypium stocksii TaxID=47602 RepID=A0A9D3UTH6_9ROSI|nr:hypothetical protein J1N35_034935 [Gossypium stocksii]